MSEKFEKKNTLKNIQKSFLTLVFKCWSLNTTYFLAVSRWNEHFFYYNFSIIFTSISIKLLLLYFLNFFKTTNSKHLNWWICICIYLFATTLSNTNWSKPTSFEDRCLNWGAQAPLTRILLTVVNFPLSLRSF